MSMPFGELPTRSQYAVALPALQVKVTLEEEKADPNTGLSICTVLGVGLGVGVGDKVGVGVAVGAGVGDSVGVGVGVGDGVDVGAGVDVGVGVGVDDPPRAL